MQCLDAGISLPDSVMGSGLTGVYLHEYSKT